VKNLFAMTLSVCVLAVLELNPRTAYSQTPGQQTALAGFEYDIDRPGYDYRNFELPSADPALCAAQCAAENQCQAWTYVKPGVQGTLARCWLKHRVPPPVPGATFAISGVKGASQPGPPGNFAGRWDVILWGTVIVAQDGNSVSGTYSKDGGGTLTGTVEGSMLRGQSVHNDGRRCVFQTNLAPDGMSFKGTSECVGWGGTFDGTRSK
jgi:PAN domain